MFRNQYFGFETTLPSTVQDNNARKTSRKCMGGVSKIDSDREEILEIILRTVLESLFYTERSNNVKVP